MNEQTGKIVSNGMGSRQAGGATTGMGNGIIKTGGIDTTGGISKGTTDC